MLNTKMYASPTFELVLVLRKPDKKITVFGETKWIPGDPTGTKSVSSDSADEIAEFYERTKGVKKKKTAKTTDDKGKRAKAT